MVTVVFKPDINLILSGNCKTADINVKNLTALKSLLRRRDHTSKTTKIKKALLRLTLWRRATKVIAPF